MALVGAFDKKQDQIACWMSLQTGSSGQLAQPKVSGRQTVASNDGGRDYVPYFGNVQWYCGYLSLVQDMYDCFIVVWDYFQKQDMRPATAVLRIFSVRRTKPGTMLYSDRSSTIHDRPLDAGRIQPPIPARKGRER